MNILMLGWEFLLRTIVAVLGVALLSSQALAGTGQIDFYAALYC